MFFWLVVASAVTGLGVIFEAPGELHELTRWWKLKRLKKAIGWKVPITFLGLVLVIGGIIGEGIFEFLSADAETSIRAYDEKILGETIIQAGSAKESAEAAKKDAELARGASSDAVVKAGKASTASAKALGEADSFESDITSAKKTAADAESHLADALERAAHAESESAKAQTELSRMTTPIQSVPVINGVARPDPMKGTKQSVLLRADTVIILPKLDKGKSLDWTLLVIQDDAGNRQFGTIPKVMPGGEENSPFGNVLFFAPHTVCTMEMTSDENGTIDKSFGGASCTTPRDK
ncbi:MAG: hypothetical protein ABSA39_06685 [Edaphobacter sp.]